MIQSAVSVLSSAIDYPESDGLPLADNSLQFQWIITLANNLAALFHDDPEVFVCGNQFWYPVKGEPRIRVAPDVYVVFGRPKGHRPSYKQWLEGNIPMTVVFEVLSPGNTLWEMADKLAFYEDYGAEEYYVYDPDSNRLLGYVRHGQVLLGRRPMNGFISPRLKIQFDLSGPVMVVRYPDGRPFMTFEDLTAERNQVAAERDRAAAERNLVAAERDRVTTEWNQAAAERDRVTTERNQAAAERDRAAAERDNARQRAARMAELSRKVLRQEATPGEVEELQRLINGSS